MVQSEDTIDMEMEIDLEEVTEDSVAELEQIDAIRDDEVEKFKTYVDLKQTTADADPEYTAPSSVFAEKVETVASTIRSGVSYLQNGKDLTVAWVKNIIGSVTGATAYGTISDLDVNRLYHRTYLNFTIESDTEQDIDVSLKTDSTEFATLLEYYNADNAHELDQEKLVQNISPNSEEYTEYYLPQDISLLGQIRYKLLGATATLSEKSSVTQDPLFFSIISVVVGIVVGLFGCVIGGVISILIDQSLMFDVVIPSVILVFCGFLGLGGVFLLLYLLQVGSKKMFSYLSSSMPAISELSSDR